MHMPCDTHPGGQVRQHHVAVLLLQRYLRRCHHAVCCWEQLTALAIGRFGDTGSCWKLGKCTTHGTGHRTRNGVIGVHWVTRCTTRFTQQRRCKHATGHVRSRCSTHNYGLRPGSTHTVYLSPSWKESQPIAPYPQDMSLATDFPAEAEQQSSSPARCKSISTTSPRSSLTWPGEPSLSAGCHQGPYSHRNHGLLIYDAGGAAYHPYSLLFSIPCPPRPSLR